MNILLILLFGVVIKLPVLIKLFNLFSRTDQNPSDVVRNVKSEINFFDFFLWLVSLGFWAGVIYVYQLIFS